MARIDGNDVVTDFMKDDGTVIQLTFADMISEFQVITDMLKATQAELAQALLDIAMLKQRTSNVANTEGRIDQLEESYSSNQTDYQDRLAKLESKVRVIKSKTDYL